MPRSKPALGEREIIACMRHSGDSVEEIARCLKRHRTTVSRELRRNRDSSGVYLPVVAHQQAFERRSSIRLGHDKISDNRELRSYVLDHLRGEYWSPDILAGRHRRDQRDGGSLHLCLSHGRKGYRKRGSDLAYRAVRFDIEL
jgi:IS30 family transposase